MTTTPETFFAKINQARLVAFADLIVNSPQARSPWSGETPLHIAAIWGDLEAVWILLDAGAEIDLPGEDGFTPLHEAINQGHVDAVKLLVSRGADLKRSSQEGNARDLATAGTNEEIRTFVQEAGWKM